MHTPKFKIGQRITVNSRGDIVEGHIVLILNPFEPSKIRYYCSMYPGALRNYHYVDCVDLNCISINNDKTINTMQALNIYKEEELSLKEI